MKRFLALFLMIIFVSGLSACGEKDSEPADTNTSSSPASSAESTTDTTSSDASTPDDSSSGIETSSSTNSVTSSVTEETAPSLPFNTEEGGFDGGNALALTDKGVSGLTANRILNRSSWEIFHAYIYENFSSIETKAWEYQREGTTILSKQYAVPESIVYQYAAKFFDINDATKNLLKASDRYDSAKGIYWICPPDAWFTGFDATAKGYEALGNDTYTVYVQAREVNHDGACNDCATTNSCVISQPLFKINIKATGEKGYVITSFDYINEVPNSATKVQ